MNRFLRELLPPALPFFEREIGRLTRPSRGWVRGRCPFHESRSGKSFSVHVDGHFFCHGCQAKGGDLVAFVQLRDKCDFPTACRTLGCWRDVDPAEQARIHAENLRRQEAREHEVKRKQAEREHRIKLRNEIHNLVRIHRDAAAWLDELCHAADATSADEIERWWATLALTHENLRLTEAEYLRLCGFNEEDL
jgi:hypothetical protein